MAASGLEGQYFNFDRTAVVGLQEGGEQTLTVTVSPSGGGDEVTGEIVVWGNPNGGSTGDAHGRFNGNPVAPAPGQFSVGDVLRNSCLEPDGCANSPCAADPHSHCASDHGSFSCPCFATYSRSVIEVTSVDHSSGAVGMYFNFDGAAIDLERGETMYMQLRNVRTGEIGEVVVWGVDEGSTGDSHGRFTGNPIDPAEAQWEAGDLGLGLCLPATRQSCTAGVTMDSLGQCRPHDALVENGLCVTSNNVGGECAPVMAGTMEEGREACRLLLSELLAGDNPGQASAAEYSGDSRQVCWVVTGSAPRPNGNGPYHCFHEFDCSNPGAVCMEAGGEVSCECGEGTSSSGTIEVTSIDHASGLEGQYFNFDRTAVVGRRADTDRDRISVRRR
eukprot:SAG11_NODE_94_length_17057_cov_255.471754_7_plen_389_part_00